MAKKKSPPKEVQKGFIKVNLKNQIVDLGRTARDLNLLADELMEWARKESSMNLNGFCCTRIPPLAPFKLLQYAKENEDFRVAYEAAKAFLGDRRERRLNSEELHQRAYESNKCVYDHFIKNEKIEDDERAINLKHALEKSEYTDEQLSTLKSLTNMIEKSQSDSLARKMEAINNSDEHKS